jgi:hypothetical protein
VTATGVAAGTLVAATAAPPTPGTVRRSPATTVGPARLARDGDVPDNAIATSTPSVSAASATATGIPWLARGVRTRDEDRAAVAAANAPVPVSSAPQCAQNCALGFRLG